MTVDGYIIVTEFCERLAYYGFAGSLVLFFQTQLGFSNAEADVQYSYWSGACYVTPLVGGYIADTYLGRYKAILVSFHVSCLSSPSLHVSGLQFDILRWLGPGRLGSHSRES
jgi:peptide/histidine transporter 3/4